VRALAAASVSAGKPTAWFEALYREAGGDATQVPWADLRPNDALAAWTSRPAALDGVRTAVVVGCGLGHDAEHLAARGLDVTAFDVSPTAIDWCRRLHPSSRVRYVVADLLALPSPLVGAFDLVVEVYTLQALPSAIRGAAAAAVRSLMGPRGRLFVFARMRDDGPGAPPFDEATMGPPWPLGRRELAAFVAGLVPFSPFVEVPDAVDPSIVRGHGCWTRTPSA